MRERPRFSGLESTASAGKTDSEANVVSGGVSKANAAFFLRLSPQWKSGQQRRPDRNMIHTAFAYF
jgi:hypothetical protein